MQSMGIVKSLADVTKRWKIGEAQCSDVAALALPCIEVHFSSDKASESVGFGRLVDVHGDEGLQLSTR
jgi:hypothetical protein